MIGLLAPMAVLVGYDCCVHMSEETKDASRTLPNAISTYTNGQQDNSNHPFTAWSLTLTELTLLPISVLVLDIC
jgi:amino acid transporter